MERPRALISVWDKTGIEELAESLNSMDWELISTGGTASKLREAGIEVTDVSEITGHPEVFDGRVKTLHPAVHGGILVRRESDTDMQTLSELGYAGIDLVCVNLYPFAATVAKENCSIEEAIENIDIGGPTMVRAAAKNHAAVTVVTDPGDYDAIITELGENSCAITDATRSRLAQRPLPIRQTTTQRCPTI